MELIIRDYDASLFQQVIQLFVMEYGVEEKSFGEYFRTFYEHPFQKERCIRAVAMDGQKLAGFQTFFFWPYLYKGKEYNSYQSGNSLVHPDYRGKGIFAKLLTFVEEKAQKSNIDFLMGFPVEASYGSFIRKKWSNVLNLQWYVKRSSFLSPLLSHTEKKLNHVFSSPDYLPSSSSAEIIRLHHSKDFCEWRKAYQKNTPYYQYVFKKGTSDEVRLTVKFQTRKKYLKEMVIGDLEYGNLDASVLKFAVAELCKAVTSKHLATFVSIALNPADEVLLKHVESIGFKKIEKKIYFIHKPIKDLPELDVAAHWKLYRSDIDTW
jgi:GNAT superfamily N-acetyltransferase